MTANDFHAVVIGGGLAGSAASAILAELGHCVLVLEREKFPRCHFGDVNKDSSSLWNRVRKFVPLPENLPEGGPIGATVESLKC